MVGHMFSGDEESAVKEMIALLSSRTANEGMSAEQVEGAVRKALTEVLPAADPAAEAERLEKERANKVFADEFSHLNTESGRAAVLAMAEQVKADPVMRGRPLDEITREAGFRVTRDFGIEPTPTPAAVPAQPQPTPEQPADLGERYARKARRVIVPGATPESGQHERHGGEPEPDTAPLADNSAYIKQMRANRGLYT